jgi:hypothetical protein
MNEYTNVTDSNMLKFLEQKLGIPQTYPMEVKDELPYLQHIYKHLKEVWYGLMIASLRLPSPKVDSFIKKWGDKALDAYCRSVEWDRKHPYTEPDPKDWKPMRIIRIGVLTL